ncbi:MAG: hypothetical protein U9N85_12050, partial [Bacteroidota bacterium]|nr:hypothetical protein [Bacteroidota bacterium]
LKFTSNFIITKNSRITAEFEYSDKNYMRLLSGGHTYIDRKKGNFFVNILSENELRNQPISQELTEKQKLILKNSGDDPTLAVIPSETEIDTIDENRVGYIKKDTLVDNIIYKNIFEYEPIQTKAEYYVNFSFAGSNKGNYMREKNTINGKVFRWVAPVKGIPQGNYAPRKQLVSPKKQTMISLGGNYSIGKNMTLKLETAITDSDNNLYSEIDDSDNRGFAMNTGLEAVIDSSSTGILSAKANYLHTDKNLTPFETFRSQEFERDYNITDKLEGKETQHLSWGAGLNGNPKITSNYSGNLIALGNDFRALKNELSFNYTGKKLNSQNVGSMLFAGDSLTISQFLRYSSLLELKTKYTVFGIKEEGEKNIFENTIDRNLQERSYRFNELSVYIRNPEGSKRQYRIEYTNREEFIPEGNQLMFENFAHNFRMQSQVFDSRKQRLKISGNYRIASISDTLENNPSPSGNFAGNINYNLHLFNHAVSMAVFAEHTTGNRMKQDFSYIEVADGQGIYSWKDFNENGLKELDEFVEAQFADEADYIRISLPTDEYIKNYEQKAELSFLLNPHRFNMKDTGLTGIINNFSNRLLFQPSRSIDTQWSPASLSIPDSMLFSQKNNIQNFINYKSDGGKLIVTHRFAQTTNRSVLINGISEMSNQFHRLSLQYNYQNWSLSPLFKTGIKERFTEYPATGNYSIAYHKYSLETRFNNSKSREALFSLSVKNEQNTQADEKLTGYQLKLNVIFKVPGGNNTNAEFQFVQNNFEGRTNSAPAYEMMEGLKPGKNFVWSLTRNTKLSNYLQLSLRYSGRKSENNPFIHTGNVSIRALF